MVVVGDEVVPEMMLARVELDESMLALVVLIIG